MTFIKKLMKIPLPMQRSKEKIRGNVEWKSLGIKKRVLKAWTKTYSLIKWIIFNFHQSQGLDREPEEANSSISNLNTIEIDKEAEKQ